MLIRNPRDSLWPVNDIRRNRYLFLGKQEEIENRESLKLERDDCIYNKCEISPSIFPILIIRSREGELFIFEMANDSSIYFLYIKNEKEGLNYILSRISVLSSLRISPASVKFKHSKIRFSLLSVTLEDTPYKSSPSPSNFLPDESININQHDKSARVIHSVRNVSRLSCFSTARTTPCATSYAFFNRIRVPFLLRRSC